MVLFMGVIRFQFEIGMEKFCARSHTAKCSCDNGTKIVAIFVVVDTIDAVAVAIATVATANALAHPYTHNLR